MSLIFENKSLYESIGINGHHIDDCVYKHGSSRDFFMVHQEIHSSLCDCTSSSTTNENFDKTF